MPISKMDAWHSSTTRWSISGGWPDFWSAMWSDAIPFLIRTRFAFFETRARTNRCGHIRVQLRWQGSFDSAGPFAGE